MILTRIVPLPAGSNPPIIFSTPPSINNRATRCFERGLTYSREADDTNGIDQTLISLGNLARAPGDFARATTLFEEVLAHARAINLTWGIANTLTSLALVACGQGDYARALARYRESLTLHRNFGNKTYIVLDFEGIATAACMLGQPARAVQLCAAAEQVRKEMCTPRPPAEQERYDHTLDAVCQALGHDAYKHARAIGTTLLLQEAIAFALSDVSA